MELLNGAGRYLTEPGSKPERRLGMISPSHLNRNRTRFKSVDRISPLVKRVSVYIPGTG
jgi:hypothetical protein